RGSAAPQWSTLRGSRMRSSSRPNHPSHHWRRTATLGERDSIAPICSPSIRRLLQFAWPCATLAPHLVAIWFPGYNRGRQFGVNLVSLLATKKLRTARASSLAHNQHQRRNLGPCASSAGHFRKASAATPAVGQRDEAIRAAEAILNRGLGK